MSRPRNANVLCHSHEWCVMMENWYKIGMPEKKPVIPAGDVTWQTLPILNHRIWKKYKATELKKVIVMLKKSRKDIGALIEKYTNDELFIKKNTNGQE